MLLRLFILEAEYSMVERKEREREREREGCWGGKRGYKRKNSQRERERERDIQKDGLRYIERFVWGEADTETQKHRKAKRVR